jgi:hypothetical protein
MAHRRLPDDASPSGIAQRRRLHALAGGRDPRRPALPQVHRRPRLQPGLPAAPPPGLSPGDIRATGDVLVDQLAQMQRSGFSSAVLRADQDAWTLWRAASCSALRGFLPGRCGPYRAPFCVNGVTGMNSAIALNARPSSKTSTPETGRNRALLRQAARATPKHGDRPRPRHAGVQPGRRRRGDQPPDQQPANWTSASSCWKPACCTRKPWPAAGTHCGRVARTGAGLPARSNESVVQFVAREGKDAMYKSIACARPAATSARWSRWSAHWRASAPGSPACAANSRRPRRCAADRHHDDPARVKFNPLANWTWGDVWHYIAHAMAWTTTRCTTSFSPASAARPAPAPSAWAKTSAPAAGGGKTKRPRNAACTSKTTHP